MQLCVPGGSLTKRRIMVADDNVDAASTLGTLLEIMGHEVRIVHDGKAAVEAAAAFSPDVVLLDIGMPHLNGYEACSGIRMQSSNKDLLIVALTGWTGDNMKERARQAGFDYYLIKPVEIAAIENLLQDHPASPT